MHQRVDFAGGGADIWSETGQGGMVGTPWQFRERYIENSPFFYLDRVETPLLIVQGDQDPIGKQADAVFVALRRLGKKVMYAKYVGEGHWENNWSWANVKDYWNRVSQWFDDIWHVQNAAMTMSLKQGCTNSGTVAFNCLYHTFSADPEIA